MNYVNSPLLSPFSFYIPPEAKWWFIGVMVLFVIAIHMHAINRD